MEIIKDIFIVIAVFMVVVVIGELFLDWIQSE